MNLVYGQRDVLVGPSNRKDYPNYNIFVFAYFVHLYVKECDRKDLVHVGMLWLGLTLAFEWTAVLP